MPVFKKEIETGPQEAEPTVRVRVTKQGHGKISTGVHNATDGEEFFAEGEEIDLPKSIAEALMSGEPEHNHAGSFRHYVDIAKPAKAA
ncbi:MAG: hypothetical protein NVV72_15740 [Asticcacaulis sp.]|nr:hypothetical protein [Asticcacaulis sp.]